MEADWQATWALLLEDIVRWTPKLISGLVLFVVGMWLSGLAAQGVERALEARGTDTEIRVLLVRIARIGLICLATVLALQQVPGGLDIQRVRGGGVVAPRQIGDELEVRADDGGLAALRVHAPQPAQLPVHDHLRVVGELGLLEPSLQIGQAAVVVAQLGLDRPQLVAQQGLLLVSRQVLPHVTV